MTVGDWLLIAAILPLLIASAFFSGSETALTAASRARMHSLDKSGDRRATIVNRLIGRRDQLIGALLIGNNLVNILASAIATSVFLKLFGDKGVALATITMTVVVVVFAEVMPKYLAISAADGIALRIARPVAVIVALLSPFASAVSYFVRFMLRLLGARVDRTQSLLSAHEEIRGAVEILHRDGSVIRDDRYRLGAILDLHELEISDVMIHRTKMVSINAGDPPAEILRQILASQHTRIPIWKGQPDNIVGILHARDVLRFLGGHEDPAKFDAVKMAAEAWFVPESTPLKDQLNAFLRRKAHMALVVDEYGEVMGLVTLEDILEEIVGDITDEHDIEVTGVQPQSDGSVIVEGTVTVRDLNRALDWELPDDEATTVAGLVIQAAQMIPEEKQAFSFFGKRFVVLQREKNRITKLRIRNLPG